MSLQDDTVDAAEDILGVTTVEKDDGGGSLVDSINDTAEDIADSAKSTGSKTVKTVEDQTLDRFDTLEEAEAAFDRGDITAAELGRYGAAFASGDIEQGKEQGPTTTAEKTRERRQEQSASDSSTVAGLSTRQLAGLGILALAGWGVTR